MTWMLTVLSLIGTVANIYRRRWCFAVWIGTNAAWAIVDWAYGLYAQSALFAVYTGLAIWGWVRWRSNN